MGSPKQKYFPLTGGLDLVTSPIKVKPGRLLASKNYEQGILGGYTRIEGNERTDGQPLPSEASYWILNFDAGGLVEVVTGMDLVGQTSGAIGCVLSVTLSTGSWPGGDAAGQARIFNVSGTFTDDELVSFIGILDGLNSGFSGGFA